MSKFEPWFYDPICCASALGPLALFDWRSPPTPAQTQASWKCLEAHTSKYPNGILMFALVRESARGLPDKAGMEQTNKLTKHFSPQVKYRVAVVEGDGVRRSFLRAVVYSLSSIMGDAKSSCVGSTVDEVAEWTAARLRKLDPSCDLDGVRLGQQIAQARQVYDNALRSAR